MPFPVVRASWWSVDEIRETMGVMGLEEHGRPGPKVFEGPVDIRRVVATAEDLFGTRYAGIWYSDGGTEQKLVIGVVDAATSDQAGLRQRLGGGTSWLDVVGVRHSRAELDGYLRRLNAIVDTHRPTKSIVLAPHPPGNCIRVSLNREDAERLLPLLKAAVPEDALSIEVTGFTVEPQTP